MLFGADNIVALIDPGRKLKIDPNPHVLEIKEKDGAEIRKRVMQARDTFSETGIDLEFRAASLPATFNSDARFFEIKGRIKPIGFPGLEVLARSAGRKIEARLYVAVLPEIRSRWRSAMSWSGEWRRSRVSRQEALQRAR